MKKILKILSILTIIWVVFDIFYPKKVNLKEFNPSEISRLDAEMWRSYYEKKPLKLFWQSAELMREQLHAPFWRSFVIAFHAAKAAFVFKNGKNRTDYEKALPNLEKYYDYINDLSDKPFDIKTTAKQELEWWIIRRYREQHPPTEWADLQAKVAAQLYQVPAEKFNDFARIRTQAMFFRDEKGENITENDWKIIQKLLDNAWKSLHEVLK